jgi:DNA-binding NtrC family response regulator
LLLDEIGEMPLHLQPKLLRVLQERELRRLGETRNIPVDIRVVATTNRSLAGMVREGLFRADLYYRLNVIALTLPPLRDRREDIPLLAEHFLERHAPGRGLRLAGEFLERLCQHSWPGNVRELENSIRRAVALSPGEEITAELQPGLFQATNLAKQTLGAGDAGAELHPGMKMQDMERTLLERTLAATGGNRSRAAVLLGISLRTVRNKIREYGLPPRGAYGAD